MESSIKWQLLKERIAAKAEVKITEEDLLNYATHIAARQFAQYGMTNMDQETLTSYAKNLLSDKHTDPISWSRSAMRSCLKPSTTP